MHAFARQHVACGERRSATVCMREHAACVQVVDKDLCQLVVCVVKDANLRVDRHAENHAEEPAVVVDQAPVKEADAVE